jgi:signal transduction histidine kinase
MAARLGRPGPVIAVALALCGIALGLGLAVDPIALGALLLLAAAPAAVGLLTGLAGAAVTAVAATGTFAAAARFGAAGLEGGELVGVAGGFLVIAMSAGMLGALLGARIIAASEAETENAELRKSVSALVTQVHNAEDRERERIAQELHDGTMQTLLVVNQDLIEAVEKDPGLSPVQQAVTDVLAEMRRAVSELHPATVTHGDLDASARAIATRAAELGRFEVELSVDPDAGGINDALVVAILREFLTNAAKHAHADHVGVSVRMREDDLVAAVVDDGVGANLEERSWSEIEGGVGLAAIRERVKAIGGSLELSTPPGGGTFAMARLPIPPGARDRAGGTLRQ